MRSATLAAAPLLLTLTLLACDESGPASPSDAIAPVSPVLNTVTEVTIPIATGNGTRPSIPRGGEDPDFTWNYTADFADTRFPAFVQDFSHCPFVLNPDAFAKRSSCIMPNGNCGLNDADGDGTNEYQGVEFMYFAFDLPANARNVELGFTTLTADDRVQVRLNGHVLGYWQLTPFSNPGIGRMDGLGSQPDVTGVLFHQRSTNLPTVTDQSFFNIGGLNVIRFWINNTGSRSPSAFARRHGSLCDPSALEIRATVTYEVKPIPVDIDIKPGSDPNSINCRNKRGVIPVAILTTDDFDATTVDHTTVAFEGATEAHVNRRSGEPLRHEEDVDSDGDIDLVFHFEAGETDLDCDSEEGTLTGETFDGQEIEGTDDTRMVGR